MKAVRLPNEHLYRLAVGRYFQDGYIRKFQAFAGGTERLRWLSWNRGAFFFTIPWMLYRKMWVEAVVYAALLFAPFIAIFAMNISPALKFTSAMLFIVLPAVYGDAIYFWHCSRLVDRADRTNDTECLMRRGGTSLLALASLLLLGGAFLGALLLVGQDNLASLPPTPHSVGYEHAERLYLKGDYSTAVVELRSLAAKGDPDADYLLGYMHFTGVGVKRDVDAAITLYRSAADKGIQQAQLSLGLIYYRQPSLALGDPHGLEWVAKANKYAKTMMKQGGEVER